MNFVLRLLATRLLVGDRRQREPRFLIPRFAVFFYENVGVSMLFTTLLLVGLMPAPAWLFWAVLLLGVGVLCHPAVRGWLLRLKVLGRQRRLWEGTPWSESGAALIGLSAGGQAPVMIRAQWVKAGNGVWDRVFQFAMCPGVKPADFQAKLPDLLALFDSPLGTLEVVSPTEVELRLREVDPLAEALILDATPECDDSFAAIPYGVAEDGSPVTLDLRDTAGMLAGGLPGSGKTASGVITPLTALASSNSVQIAIFDGKGGDDLAAFRERAWIYCSEDEDLDRVVSELERVDQLMRQRLRAISRQLGRSNVWADGCGPTPDFPLVVTVIDECQAYLDPSESMGDKSRKELIGRCQSLVKSLVKKGRSVGMLTVLATQKPTSDAVPTAIRDACAIRVGFSVKARENSVAILGEIGPDDFAPHQIPAGKAGQGIAAMAGPSGRVERVRVAFLPPVLIPLAFQDVFARDPGQLIAPYLPTDKEL